MAAQSITSRGSSAHSRDHLSLPSAGLPVSPFGLNPASRNVDQTIYRLLQDVGDEEAIRIAHRMLRLGQEGLCHLRSLDVASGESK